MSEICFIEAKPRIVATGAETTIRLAGGGSDTPYRLAGNDYRAGVVEMPRFRAAFGFDDNGWTGGTIPTSGALGFMPGDSALVTALMAHYWRDAAITVDAGDEKGALSRRLTGTVADVASSEGQISLALADPSKLVDKPLLGAGFAGTGGIEGASEATGRPKRRSWGRVFNVELELLDKVNNIFEAGDPSKPLQAFDAVRDKGRAGSMAVLAWQGSIAATFAALQASTPAQGGCVAAPSIACVKWWTVPAGPLTADIRGENAGGYVETAVAIAAKMLATVAGPAIHNQAAADALRPGVCGVHVASPTDTVAQALDRLFLGVSLFWVLKPDATIRIGEWAWKAPVAAFEAEFIGRERLLPPVKSRIVGYRRNHRVHNDSEISAALLLSDDITYLDGTPIEALKPGQAGADVTGDHTAAAIDNQGALATQSLADWRTQIASRPAIAELYYDMNYASIAEMTAAGWVLPGGSNVSLAAHNSSPGGKVLIMGTGTGGTAGSLSAFGPEWVPYNAGDLYEVAFDIEVISAEAGSFYYLGVEGQDRAGNTLGGSHNYVAASNISQPSKVGQRFLAKGYFTGYTTAGASGQSNSPLAPAPLPDGTAGGFGQGGVTRFRPLILTNYNNLKGQVYVHAVRVTRLPARLAAQSEVAFGTVAITETAGGPLASLANFKTGLGTAAAIVSQGALATSNAANWKTQVLGIGKPSNNAGVARILTAVGTGDLVGNTLRKITGSHGVHEGGAIGAIQRNTAFVSSGLLADTNNVGGWITTLALDLGTGTVNPNSLVNGSFFCTYQSSDPNGSLVIYKRVAGSSVALGGYTVPGVAALDRRMALICNGRRVFVMINGTQYGGDNSNFDVAPGTSFYPRVFDYHRTDSQSRTDGIEDIQYGEWNDVRVHLDDGYSILNQAGFKTDEGTASGIAGQGPGATAPGADVLNYNDGGGSMTIVRAPTGGQIGYGSPQTGCIKIALPQGYINTMLRFAVDVFDYASGESVTYLISGYNYAAVSNSNGYWVSVSAQFIGPETQARRVRFGHDGTRCCIWIGETSSGWDYPNILVRDLMAGYSNYTASLWKSGWDVSVSAAAPANGSQAIAEITKPRAGDTVLGESIFESAAGAVATLANFKTQLGTASAIVGQGVGATSNSLNDLDATAAATLAGLTANGAVTVGESQIIKKNIPAGGSVTLNGRVGIAAGGGSGTLAARIQVSLSGSFSWSTVNTSGTVPIGPGEPGSVTVTGTFTNTSGAAALYDFRIAEVVSPGGSGGGIVSHQTYLSG